jgi:hypothetical protein
MDVLSRSVVGAVTPVPASFDAAELVMNESLTALSFSSNLKRSVYISLAPGGDRL